MTFEKIGKWVFQTKRIPIFLACLSLGPLMSAYVLYLEEQSFTTLAETSSLAVHRAKTAFQRKARKDSFLAKHSRSDPYFLDKEIESFSFLHREKEQVKGWLSHPAVANRELLARRLEFLESSDNRLSFAEEDTQSSKQCKETMEKQRHAIEADAQDLQKLLGKIEEISFHDEEMLSSNRGRPQLLICNFSMTKKNAPLQNEVFEITMDLLKREFIAK